MVVTSTTTVTSTNKGGLYRLDPVAGTVQSMNAVGDLVYSGAVECDPYNDEVLWVGTSTSRVAALPDIHRVTARGGKILQDTPLRLPLNAADRSILQMAVLGDELLFLTHTRLCVVPISGGTFRVLRASVNVDAIRFATDGRNLYLHLKSSVSEPNHHVARYDLEDLQAAPTTIYRCASYNWVSGMALDLEGNVVLADSDLLFGSCELKQLSRNGGVLRSLTLPFTDGTGPVAVDPATSTVVVVGYRFDATIRKVIRSFLTYVNWRPAKPEFGISPEAFQDIAVRRHLPMHRHGHVCQAAPGWRAEISADELPARGNSTYSLNLRGPAGRPAILLVGMHGQLPAPISLRFLGAGTCELGVREILAQAYVLDSAGSLKVPAPIPATVGVAEFDVQFLVGDPAANSAGFVSSQVGSVVLR